MRHRVAKRHFGRDTNHRKALLMGLVRSLVEQGSIVTTQAKAKEVRRIADKLISRAQTDSVERRRLLHKFFGKRDVVNTLVERVAPAMKDRKSGFSTLVAVGQRRGDNTQLFRLSLVIKQDRLGTLKAEAKVRKPKVKKAKSVKTIKDSQVVKAKKTVVKPVAQVTPKTKKK